MAQGRKWLAVGGQAGADGRTGQVSTSGAELSGVCGSRFFPALHRFTQHQAVLHQASRTAKLSMYVRLGMDTKARVCPMNTEKTDVVVT